MARLNLQFPDDHFVFETSLSVRITDINAGNHLANDSMISMISEARARFLFHFGVEEMNVDRIGIIVTDLATMYKNEAHARDLLRFEVGVMDFNKYGCDIIFRITRPADGLLIALAKSGFVFYNYDHSKVVLMPERIRDTFEKALGSKQHNVG
ncbi:MAG TPA: thioesterase family protein [Limnobacter sp.]|nr:thioesterase family protein [Limnobacter sp.]